MDTMEEKEDGEISLEDVSSSDDGQSNCRSRWSPRISPTRRSHSVLGAGYGKENRRYSCELNSRYVPNPASKPDGLLPISSDDDHEIVELPDASRQLCIHLGKKKRKKRKKKKSGDGEMMIEDYVSSTAPDPLILNAPAAPTEITVHRRRKSQSPRSTRRHSPIRRDRAFSRSPPDTPPRPFYVGESIPSLPGPHYLSRSRVSKRLRRDASSEEESPIRFSKIGPTLRSPRDVSPVSISRSPKAHCHCNSQNYFAYTSSLLKHVRRLEGVGTLTAERKSRDHSSLKEKLNNIMKTEPQTNDPDTKQPKNENISYHSATEEDEENLDVLRRRALQTKQPKVMTVVPDHLSDNDPEALELRMIALKSAMIKKHQKRVENGNRKRNNPRDSSLSVDSFLKDLEPCNPSSSPERSQGGQQVEDMELDTDVEREKESCSPYSPTDEIIKNCPAIRDYPNTSCPEVKLEVSTKKENGSDLGDVVNMEAPYSPTDPAKTQWGATIVKKTRQNVLKTITIDSGSENSETTPYSPSDSPMYDFELPYSSPVDQGRQNDDSFTVLEPSMNNPSITAGDDKAEDICEKPPEGSSPGAIGEVPAVNNSFASQNHEPTPHEGPPPLREIPPKEENEQKQSTSSGVLSNCTLTNPYATTRSVSEVTNVEPLYLRGLPEVTKEPNKIPILVNKSLVPASILKTNKNLQQPLPPKRTETATEPTFKSAVMQPVDVGVAPVVAATPVFQPINIQPVVKKSTVVAPAAAFNNVSVDDSVAEESTNKVTVAAAKPDTSKNKRKRGKLKLGKRKRNRAGERQRKRLRALRATNATRFTKTHVNSNRDSQMDSADLSGLSDNSSKVLNPEEPGTKKSNSTENEKEKQASPVVIKAVPSSIEESNIQKSSEDHRNDRSRRKSADDEADSLRAMLLANLHNRLKSGESRGSEEAEKGSNAVARVQNSCEVTPEVQRVVTVAENERDSHKLVDETVKTSQAMDGSRPMAKRLVTPQVPKSTSHFSTTTGVVERPVQRPKVEAAPAGKLRVNPLIVNGPPKKIVKKTAIPVSTKVVNNAKKFQNTRMQRKMILQAQAKGCTSISNISQNLKLVNLKVSEAIRPASPKMKASGAVQSLVIKLGEDSDSDSGAEWEKRYQSIGGQRDVLAIPTTDFEKSVDQFLKEQRKKQETLAISSVVATSTPASTAKGTVTKTSGLSATPLAVRHLPPSQQEEYKRLKQQIFEKERQRATRQIINTPPCPLSPASPISRPTKSFLPKIPSTLSKSPNPPDPKSSIKAPVSKPSTVDENSCQKSSQPSPITTRKGASDQYIINNSSASSQKMENLSIQIPNDNVTPGGRIVFNKPENSVADSSIVSSALRILTTDQLNSKFAQAQLRQRSRTVTVADGGLDKSIGELLQSNNVDLGGDNTKNNEDSMGNNEVNELSAIGRETDNSNVNRTSQEVSGGDSGSITVDSEASTVILPPREAENEGEEEHRDSEDSTIVLDETVEERPVETQRIPSRAKGKSPTKEYSEKIKSDVKAELESLAALSEEQRCMRLKDIEQELVTKRSSVLDDLTEMSSTLKQWDLERELQANLFIEVRRLKAQLAVAEARLLEQKLKINSLGPNVTNAHQMIVEGRSECLKLTKLCQGVGTKVVGPQYKVPATGAQIMIEKLKEVAYHTRELSKKKVSCENNNETTSVNEQQVNQERTLTGNCEESWNQSDGNGDNVNNEAEQSDNASGVVISRLTEEDQSPFTESDPLSCDRILETYEGNSEHLSTVEKACPEESIERLSQTAHSYESVLSNVLTPRHIDCNRVLCPFELTGVCKDDDCLYNHLEPRNKPHAILQ
ncbi:uncharacterized protein LOC135168753 [Diachasmimorpha longicaudata]|uniref:uncharacterized protein LOC135168753 n=1 Tax=Diachasmimorpha longicaudata TaxID=58733 RepID=UPI0030B91890